MPTEVNASPPDSDHGLSKRYTIGVLLVLTGLLPCLLHGVFGALDSNSNDPRQWLPRGFEETDKYDWLQQHFGNDEITVVSWPGCTLSRRACRAVGPDFGAGSGDRLFPASDDRAAGSPPTGKSPDQPTARGGQYGGYRAS